MERFPQQLGVVLVILLFNQDILLIVCFHIFHSFKQTQLTTKALENNCVKQPCKPNAWGIPLDFFTMFGS